MEERGHAMRKLLGTLAAAFAGLMLTVIALPLLFFATCFPLFAGDGHTGDTLIVIALAITAFGGYGASFHFDRTGARWTMILAATVALALLVHFVI